MESIHTIINISYNIITFIYFIFFCYCAYLKIAKKDIIKPLEVINHRKKMVLVVGLIFASFWRSLRLGQEMVVSFSYA